MLSLLFKAVPATRDAPCSLPVCAPAAPWHSGCRLQLSCKIDFITTEHTCNFNDMKGSKRQSTALGQLSRGRGLGEAFKDYTTRVDMYEPGTGPPGSKATLRGEGVGDTVGSMLVTNSNQEDH